MQLHAAWAERGRADPQTLQCRRSGSERSSRQRPREARSEARAVCLARAELTGAAQGSRMQVGVSQSKRCVEIAVTNTEAPQPHESAREVRCELKHRLPSCPNRHVTHDFASPHHSHAMRSRERESNVHTISSRTQALLSHVTQPSLI
eukprot:780494-Rhodomonas_salina.1